MRQFPIVLIPPEVQRIALSKPVVPTFDHSLPSIPNQQSPNPIQIQEAIACGFGLIVLVVLVTPAASMLGGTILIVGTIALVLRIRFQFLSYKRRYQNYQIHLQQYFRKLEAYSQEEVKYEQALAIAHSPNRLIEYRQHKFQIFFAKIPFDGKAIAFTKNSQAIAEFDDNFVDEFAIELQESIAETLYQGVKLHIASINYDWIPAFTYIDPVTNAHIAIEIDAVSENAVISTQNDLADRFLVNSGWIIIKFSRSQILQSSSECCQEFMKLLDRLSLSSIVS
jgi:very-short-patch-repair endonuclease